MVTHRIKELRKARKLTQEALGLLAGLTKFQVYRLEKGETTLDLPTAQKLAKALDVPLTQLIQADAANGHTPPGFSDDLVPYIPGDGDSLAQLAAGSHYLFVVNTDALSAAGINRGDIVRVDDTAEACKAVKPLAAVRVRLHPAEDFMQPVSLLRQFVPPKLLITNSREGNEPSIDMTKDDAHIVGIVESVHRRIG